MVVTSAATFDVFVSYSSHDRVWVLGLKRALGKRGLSVWIDQDQIQAGDLFPISLARGVNASRAAVFVISKRSLLSAWIKEEYALAMTSLEKRLIPVLIENAKAPDFLASRQFVDFRDPSAFELGVERLYQALVRPLLSPVEAQSSAPH